MRATIKSIAEHAGVSAGTVDRVLHNRPNVKPEVRERVLEAIKALNYRPNKAARALAYSDANKTLSVIFPSWSGYFRKDIEQGIRDAELYLSDFGISVEKHIYNQRDYSQCLAILQEQREKGVAGLAICAEDNMLIREALLAMAKDHIPVVTFNSDVSDCRRLCYVGQETHQSGRVAAEIISKYLREGEEVLVALGNYEYSGHRARVDGFLQRFEELGSRGESFHIIECYNDYSITFEKVKKELEAHPEIRYVYMANRSVSACAEVLRRMGSVRKVRIVCHDLTENVRQLLKEGVVDFTIEQDIYQQGYQPLILLGDMLMMNHRPEKEFQFTALNIVNAENMDSL